MQASRWIAIAVAVALTMIAARPSIAQVQPTPQAAPKPRVAGTFGLGRAATADEIRQINIDVRADGTGLPAGSGTADQGQAIFAQKCAGCHGASGEGSSIGPKLVDPTPFQTGVTAPTIGNYWPYAPTVWDYINRAMPFDMPGSLSPDEVYALTAYLLSENQIIPAAQVMDARSLPKVNMPNAAGFNSPDPRPDAP